MKKLWIIVVAVMVSAFALTGCGGSSGAKSVEPAQSAASSSAAKPAPSSDTPAPTADEKATITLQDDKNGIAVQKVAVGEQVAELTVPFQYEEKDGKRVLTEIGKATAKNVAGWFRVNQDASEGTKQVGSGNGGTKAVVYVAYEASIGQGWQTYDDLIEIDLRNI